jgi:transcriptional regulator with XRE-family HTH domain
MVMSGKPLDWVKIGERLRSIRKESGLSQRDFGRPCDVSQNMISLYEKGRSRASVDFYVQVAQLGGKTIEWLLTGHQDHALETLREMRDLHEKMTGHLAVVRKLLNREADDVWDRAVLPVDDPDHLRDVLLTEKELPACLREMLEDPVAWRELAMTGREVYAFCSLTETFGDLDNEGLHLFLRLVRRATRTSESERPFRSIDQGPAQPGTAHALSADPD